VIDTSVEINAGFMDTVASQDRCLEDGCRFNDELTKLALAAVSGNHQAYEMLVNNDEFITGLSRATKWICRGSTIEADELLSEFFLRFQKKITKFSNRDGASILSWSSGVLRFLHIDLLRRKWRDTDKVDYLELLPAETERVIDTPDVRVALNQAFGRLSDREKKLISLRWSEETLDGVVAGIEKVNDAREIANRRPKISRELKAVEMKLREALTSLNTGRLHGTSGPLKAEY
jgi:RNA polymerase sigma factor (sigma-70 family)